MATFTMDDETVRRAEAILGPKGYTTSQLVKLMITHIAAGGEVPFELGTPNAKTIEAMRARSRGDTKRFESIDDFAKDLHADD